MKKYDDVKDDAVKYDDGTLCWRYVYQYTDATKKPKDWYYTVMFETKDGGILNGEAITCCYWDKKNLLKISKDKSGLNFYVENFDDIEKILLPLIKANNAIPYSIYKSRMSNAQKLQHLRKKKLNKINKL